MQTRGLAFRSHNMPRANREIRPDFRVSASSISRAACDSHAHQRRNKPARVATHTKRHANARLFPRGGCDSCLAGRGLKTPRRARR